MLGCAVYMMGIDKANLDFFRMGDAVFLRTLEMHVKALYKIINDIIQFRVEPTGEDEVDRALSSLVSFLNGKDPSKYYEKVGEFLMSYSEYYQRCYNKDDLSRAFQKILCEELGTLNQSDKLFVDKDRIPELLTKLKGRLFAAR
jgi:hypothetical protein